MVSHPELGSDLPIGSNRESGCDNRKYRTNMEKLETRNRSR